MVWWRFHFDVESSAMLHCKLNVCYAMLSVQRICGLSSTYNNTPRAVCQGYSGLRQWHKGPAPTLSVWLHSSLCSGTGTHRYSDDPRQLSPAIQSLCHFDPAWYFFTEQWECNKEESLDRDWALAVVGSLSVQLKQHYELCQPQLKWPIRCIFQSYQITESFLSTVPMGIGKHKSSKMAHFVFECNKVFIVYHNEKDCNIFEDIFSALCLWRATHNGGCHVWCKSHESLAICWLSFGSVVQWINGFDTMVYSCSQLQSIQYHDTQLVFLWPRDEVVWKAFRTFSET